MADYYTPAELEKAQSQNLYDCLHSMGYELIKEGSCYRGKLHDSIVINTANHSFHWNSKDIHGFKPVELLKQILIHDYGYDDKSAYITAIKRLAGTEGQNIKPDVSFSQNKSPSKTEQKKENLGKIILPKHNRDNNKTIEYLCGKRGLDKDIVASLIQQKKIYETKDYHNVCFVSYGKDGIPHHAFLRGTYSKNEKEFKKDVDNSDKSYPFIIRGNENTNKVYCFESSIDAISHATLYKMNNLDYKDGHRISLHCTSFLGLEQFLKDNPQIEEIVACLDNDEAGIRRSKKLCVEYKEKGYFPFLQLPQCKDYNQQLTEHIKELELQATENDIEIELE